MTAFKLSKFVSRYELEPLYSVDGTQKLHYVIDIYFVDNYFSPRVKRRDYFLLYPLGVNELCEEELLVFDNTEKWEMINAENEKDLVQKIISKLEKKCGL